MSGLHKELRQPSLQRRVFALAQASPTEIMRSRLSRSEIQHRALAFLPDDLLDNVPAEDHTYSLFQGFQATLPSAAGADGHNKKGHRRHGSRGRKLLAERGADAREGPPSLADLKAEKDAMVRRLEMLGIRKSLTSSEIREIDGKLAKLNKRRRIVLDRLAELEQEETLAERDCELVALSPAPYIICIYCFLRSWVLMYGKS
jgi:division protein 1